MDKTNPQLLEPLLEAGYQLIPLHRWDSITEHKGKKQQRGKSPLHKNWPKRPYDSAEQIGHMKNGRNVGVRLRAEELVIDVDPRAFPEGENLDTDNPLARLCKDTGLEVDDYPTVRTGSGGLHIYMRKPEAIAVRDGLPDYPGVEFKSLGRQVVAPGSIHPGTKRVYEWIENEALADLDFLGIASVPDTLVELIRKPERSGNATGGGEYSAEQLARMLGALEPEDFGNHEEWLQLMLACHHATAGDGRAEFIEWSTSDIVYSDDGPSIGQRWDSLNANNENGGNRVTYRTLNNILIDHDAEQTIPRTPAADDFSEPPTLPTGIREEAKKPTKKGTVKPLPNKDPMTIAAAMLNGRPILRSGGDWLRYDKKKNAYREVPKEEFDGSVWRWVNGRQFRTSDDVKSLVANRELVGNVVDASKALRQGPRDLPAWTKKTADNPDPTDLLAVRNGLLHLPTMGLLPATSRFVNRNASPVEFDPLADEPVRWLRFLKEVYQDDDETISSLQEMMGYLLTQDTGQQKIFCMVGPPRSGKGTINRIIQSLIGEGNYTSPNAKSLGSGEFGLQSLIGKQLAVISDMRMGRNSDPASVSENLLRISGEDEVSINRKFKEAWEGKLTTRFLLLSNETPQFKDTSGAIITRMILIRNSVSFLGREDPGLTTALREELAGVLNWTLEGLLRLRERGHFVQPKTSRDELAAMMTMASPVKTFAEECLRVDPEAVTAKDEIWDAFIDWIAEAGLPYSGDNGHFFKDLGTVGLRFKTSRVRKNGKRIQVVNGLKLHES